ncbi:MAG: deoxyribodipyrimidine photolyase [Planctomycetota bacterium]|nr:deoxyribodipyrimidine photolyase [Planctomycetota bacterium]
MVPEDRVAAVNAAPVRGEGLYVLHWMIAHRRRHWNYALEHAVGWAQRLGKPLVVCEYLRSGHPWSCARVHRLVIEGMCDQRTDFADSPVHYLPVVDAGHGAGAAIVRRLLSEAAIVIADEFPTYVHPRMVAALAAEAPCRVETVDANGLLPLRATTAAPQRAVDFRRILQRLLPRHLQRLPRPDPLAGVTLPRLTSPLPPASDLEALLAPGGLQALPIDHAVPPVALRGGARAARAALAAFVAGPIDRYHSDRGDPVHGVASGLSPWLHLGQLSVHEVVDAIWRRCQWQPDRLSAAAHGRKDGWWGLPPGPEAFLDELVTWRELGYHFAFHRPDHAAYESLPDWALETLDRHRADPRPQCYPLAVLERAETEDPLWNAAQRQLLASGVIHNYLRMLWGKKVIEWSESPEAAWAALDHLNNRWAIDGCNPNSWTGISWCFGRFDRPWFPERPIFGTVRWMSSAAARRKFDVDAYIARWSALRSPCAG